LLDEGIGGLVIGKRDHIFFVGIFRIRLRPGAAALCVGIQWRALIAHFPAQDVAQSKHQEGCDRGKYE